MLPAVLVEEPVDEPTPLGPKHREHERARRGNDDLTEPRPEREDDRVPEIATDVHLRPRIAEVAPGHSVREEGKWIPERVDGRRDGALREPDHRPEPDQDEQDEQEHLRRAEEQLDVAARPVRVREEAAGRVFRCIVPTETETDHFVLQARVARMNTTEKTARKAASIRLSAAASPKPTPTEFPNAYW